MLGLFNHDGDSAILDFISVSACSAFVEIDRVIVITFFFEKFREIIAIRPVWKSSV